MRGQIYSIAVVLIAIPLMLFLTFYITATQTIKFGTSEKTVSDQLTLVERNIEQDFLRVMEIAGRRSLIASVNAIVTNGTFLENSTDSLLELAVNGSLGGGENFLMVNNSLKDWRNRTLGIITQFNLDIGFSGTDVENQDGFSLVYSSNTSVDISDKLGVARIVRSSYMPSLVSVLDVEDPVFSLNTLARVPRIISQYEHPYLAMPIVQGTAANGNCTGEATFNPSVPDSEKILVTAQDTSGISGFRGIVSEHVGIPPGSCYIVGAANAVSKINSTINMGNYTDIYLDQSSTFAWSLPIIEAIENGQYMHLAGASGPTFLERLEGDLDESSNGIESFVNIPELQAEGISIKQDQTTLDYLYFSPASNKGDEVRGLPSWFRMNKTIAGRYNLTSLID